MNGKTWTFDDLEVGGTITLGEKTVTAAEIIEFASEFDAQPFHLDEEAGKASILGGLGEFPALQRRSRCSATGISSSDVTTVAPARSSIRRLAVALSAESAIIAATWPKLTPGG